MTTLRTEMEEKLSSWSFDDSTYTGQHASGLVIRFCYFNEDGSAHLEFPNFMEWTAKRRELGEDEKTANVFCKELMHDFNLLYVNGLRGEFSL